MRPHVHIAHRMRVPSARALACVILIAAVAGGLRAAGASSAAGSQRVMAWQASYPSHEYAGRSMMSVFAVPSTRGESGVRLLLVAGDTHDAIMNADVWESLDLGATWRAVLTPTPWQARNGHATVMLRDGSVLVMGGMCAHPQFSMRACSDVWRATATGTRLGTAWSRMTRAASWSPRSNHAAAVVPDPTRPGDALAPGRVVLLAGADSPIGRNDVWASDDAGMSWTMLHSSAPFSQRSRPGLAALGNGTLLLLGGTDEFGVGAKNDVWTSHDAGVTWRLVLPAAPWSPRTGAALAGLGEAGLLLLGGAEGGGCATDTWRTQDGGATWALLSPLTPLGPRCFASMLVLPPSLNGDVLVVGGLRDTYLRPADVWRSSDAGATWRITTSVPWTQRWGHWLVLDTTLPPENVTQLQEDPAVRMLGGSAGLLAHGVMRDVPDAWLSADRGGSWTLAAAEQAWGNRAAYHVLRMLNGSMLLTGGLRLVHGTVSTVLSDVWRSDDGGAHWRLVTAAAAWPARMGHSVVQLSVNGSLVLVGGLRADGAPEGSVLSWRSDDDGETWVPQSRVFLARGLHALLCLHDRNDTMLIIGGAVGARTWSPATVPALADVWESTDNGSTWEPVLTRAPWSARAGMHVERVGDVLVMVGGFGTVGMQSVALHNDVWHGDLTGSEWTRVAARVPYPPRLCPGGVVLLPASGTLVMVGGLGGSMGAHRDVWRSEDLGATWERVAGLLALRQKQDVALVALPAGQLLQGTGDSTFNSTRSTVLLMGGAAFELSTPEVWRSQDAGASWQLRRADAPWGATASASAVVVPAAKLAGAPQLAGDDAPGGGSAFAVLFMGGRNLSEGVPRSTACVWASLDEGATWRLLSRAAWPQRQDAAAVTLADDSVLVTGGQNMMGTGADTLWADAWRSTDGGVTWAQRTGAAPWGPRTQHALVALPPDAHGGGPATALLIAGQAPLPSLPLADVWRTQDGGATWELLSASVGWLPRAGCTALLSPPGARKRSVFVLGGLTNNIALTDVWRSEDAGVTWHQVEAAASWANRITRASVMLFDGAVLTLGDVSTVAVQQVWLSGCPAGHYDPLQGCVPCVPGRYKAAPGSGACEQCPPGSYSAAAGATVCTACPIGTNSSRPGQAQCQPCPPGTFSGQPGALQCQPCATGTFNFAHGATQCQRCEVGLRSGGSGATRCVPCARGTYAPAANDTLAEEEECLPCPRGTYGVGAGGFLTDACAPCPTGTYSDGTGLAALAQCKPCPMGTYGVRAGAVAAADCAACPLGTRSVSAGASSRSACLPCSAGTYGSPAQSGGEAQCLRCPAGTYSATVGGTSSAVCLQCPPGSFSTATGATSVVACQPCPAGTFRSQWGGARREDCAPCAEGAFSAALGAASNTTCQSCARGTFGPTPGATTSAACVPCAPGHYGPLQGQRQQSACLPCAMGTYSPTAGLQAAEQCRGCPRGTYGAALGATSAQSCLPCPRGTFSDAVGGASLDVCRACPAGTFGTAAGATGSGLACAPCPAGTYSNATGLGDVLGCLRCPAGTFGLQTGAVGVGQCSACPTGTYGTAQGGSSAAVCQDCPAGTYRDAPGGDRLAACANCPPGTYSTATGAANVTQCVPCPAGTYSQFWGGSTLASCTACPAGTYGTSLRAVSALACTPCAPGQFSSEVGASSPAACLPCPVGTFSAAAAAASAGACQACPVSTYSESFGATNASACLPCPTNGECEGTDAPAAMRGAWYSVQHPTLFLRCTPAAACVGGTLAPNVSVPCLRDSALPTCARTSGDVLSAQVLCAAGYTEARCSRCEDDHFRFGEVCRACPPPSTAWLRPAGLLAVLLALLLSVHFTLATGANVAVLTVGLDMLQVAGMLSKVQVPWPNALRSTLSVLSVAELDVQFAGAPCLHLPHSFVRDWLADLALPLVCVCLLLLLHLLWRCLLPAGRRATPQQRNDNLEARLCECMLLLNLLYLPIAARSLQPLDCTQLADGTMTLDAAPYIYCWQAGSQHTLVAAVGAAGAAVYALGVPLLFWLTLRWARRRRAAWLALRPKWFPVLLDAEPSPDLLAALPPPAAEALLRAAQADRVTAGLSGPFARPKWYWAMVVTGRRLLMAVWFVFFNHRPFTQLALIAATIVATLELSNRHAPYADMRRAGRRTVRRFAATLSPEQEDAMAVADAAAPAQAAAAAAALPASRKLRSKPRSGSMSDKLGAEAAGGSGATALRGAYSARQASLASLASLSSGGGGGGAAPAPRRTCGALRTRVARMRRSGNVMDRVALGTAALVALCGAVFNAMDLELVEGVNVDSADLRMRQRGVQAVCLAALFAAVFFVLSVGVSPVTEALLAACRRRCCDSRDRPTASTAAPTSPSSYAWLAGQSPHARIGQGPSHWRTRRGQAGGSTAVPVSPGEGKVADRVAAAGSQPRASAQRVQRVAALRSRAAGGRIGAQAPVAGRAAAAEHKRTDSVMIELPEVKASVEGEGK